MILLRELDHYETDVLFEHTRRSRQQVSSTASLSGPVNDNFPEDKDQSIENPATSTMEGSPECDSPSSYDVVYTCINHRDLDIQTVEHYGLSWEWDRVSSIPRYSHDDIDVLVVKPRLHRYIQRTR
jgi:hypothetical protein